MEEKKWFIRCEDGYIMATDFLCSDVEYEFATEEEYKAQQAKEKEKENRIFEAIAIKFENLRKGIQ